MDVEGEPPGQAGRDGSRSESVAPAGQPLDPDVVSAGPGADAGAGLLLAGAGVSDVAVFLPVQA